VPHLGLEEVQSLAVAATVDALGMNKERDALMIQTLFDGCLRKSEMLQLTPNRIVQTSTGWVVKIIGKGNKVGEAAISASLAAHLQSYAYRRTIQPDEKLFPMNGSRVFQIIERAFTVAGIRKPDHVGAVHVLRHSGAIYRLQVTGNPKAVQDQLRHKDAQMTMRYWKTLAVKESLEIQKGVEIPW
tara:strand:- start:296 stop:853 length:558 start_codon:yes stop_codon:yes gene_type:complete